MSKRKGNNLLNYFSKKVILHNILKYSFLINCFKTKKTVQEDESETISNDNESKHQPGIIELSESPPSANNLNLNLPTLQV